MPRERIRALLVLVAAGVALYAAALTIPLYGDDFQFLFQDPARALREAFVTTSPFSEYYRPIKVTIHAAMQILFGMDPLPRHGVALLFHLGVCWMVCTAVRGLGCSRKQGALSALLMLVSPIGAFVVGTSCALCQVMAAFFGILTLWLAHRSLTAFEARTGPSARRRAIGLMVAAVVAFVATLCSKEVGLSYVPMLLLVVLAHVIRAWRGASQPAQRPAPSPQAGPAAPVLLPPISAGTSARGAAPLLRGIAFALPFLACTAVYFWVRVKVGAATRVPGSGTPVGGTTIAGTMKNAAEMFGAVVQPASIAKLFGAWKRGELLLPVLSGFVSLTMLALALIGLWRGKNRGLVLFLAVCAVGAFFPAALLDHVSELYSYNSLPFLTSLAGIGLGSLVASLRGAAIRRAAMGFAVAFAGWQAVSVEQNIAMARQQGQWSDRVLDGVVRLARNLPPGGTLVLVDPPPPVDTYSVYVGSGFSRVSLDSGNQIRNRCGRADANVVRFAWSDYLGAETPANSMVLFLVPGTDRPYRPTERQILAAKAAGGPPKPGELGGPSGQGP